MRRHSGVLAAGAVSVALYMAISYRIASAVTAAERTELEDSPSDYGVEFEDISFSSLGGDVSLDGWCLLGRSGMPAIIIVHGVSSTRSGCGMTAVASDLNRRGFGVLLFDLRGHGMSGGDRISGGWHERLDVLGACDYLRSRGVASKNIGLLGLSMGAVAVVLAAATDPRVRAIVLDSPYARASELIPQEIARKMPLPAWLASVFRPSAELLARLAFGIDIGAMAPVEAVRRLDYPVLVLHGADDDRIPVNHGRRVHRAAHPGSALWVVDGAGHNEASTQHRSKYVDRVAAYFMARLGPE